MTFLEQNTVFDNISQRVLYSYQRHQPEFAPVLPEHLSPDERHDMRISQQELDAFFRTLYQFAYDHPDRFGLPLTEDIYIDEDDGKDRKQEVTKQIKKSRTKVVYATAKAKQLHGGTCGGRRPRAKEITHDIHVAQVYFCLERHDPELAEYWIGEDRLRAEGRDGDIPDAVIRPPGGAQLTVDFGGSYDARKLRTVHQNFSQHGRYQIW